MTTFLDASYLVALGHSRDQWHDAAVVISRRLARTRDIQIHVLALGETIALVGRLLGGRAARVMYDAVLDQAALRIPTAEELDAAMQLVVKHDGKLSLSDALFVHYMKAGDAIASFDADFDRAGVKRIAK